MSQRLPNLSAISISHFHAGLAAALEKQGRLAEPEAVYRKLVQTQRERRPADDLTLAGDLAS